MSEATAAETQHQTSETPHETTNPPTQAVQAEPQAPLQPEGDITIDAAFDDSTSAYSDEL